MATNKKPEDLLNDYKQQWADANARGDEAGKQAAHDAATALRQQMDKQNGTTSTYNPASGTWTTRPASGGGTSSGSSGGSAMTAPNTSGSRYDQNYMSSEDQAQLQQYRQWYYESQAKGNQQGMNDAHAAAEQLRKKYGYSGGSDGSRYIPEEGFWYEQPPEYTSQWDSTRNDLIDSILNSSFEDWASGSDYQYLLGRYTAMGQQAMQDTLGQVSARTGGYASSYATSAANQSYNDYMTALEDAARAMYQDSLNQQRDNLGMVNDAEQIDYSRYLTQLGQYNTDRNFAYGQYTDDRNWDYTLGRDQIEDQRYEDALDYERNQASRAETQAQVDAILQAGRTPSADLIAASGYSTEYVNALAAYYRQQLASGGSSRSSGGSSSGKSASGGGQDYEGLFAAAEQSGYPKSFISNNYKKYGFTSSSGLYDGFEDWAEGGGAAVTSYSQLGAEAQNMADNMARAIPSSNAEERYEAMVQYIQEAEERGDISAREADFLMSLIN